MSVSAVLQETIFAALTSDAGVMALVDGEIHDGPPAKAKFPRITFGPTDTQHDDPQGIRARTETIQLDVWSRDKGALGPCKAICDAVRSALHLADLSVAVGALVSIEIVGLRTFLDRDGVTAHGVVTVQAELEEPNG